MNSESQSRKHELTRSINRLVFALTVPIGILGGATLFVFRMNGMLPPDEYTVNFILFQTLVVSVILPATLVTMFWLTSLPQSQIWIVRLGALIIFIVLPCMILLAFVRAFSSN